MGILRPGSVGLFVIALLFNIVAIATPGWIYTIFSAAGLFKASSGSVVSDVVMGNAEKVVLAFSIIGDCVLITAAVCVAIGEKGDKKVYGIAGGVLGIVAGVFIMIGMATLTGLYIDIIMQLSDVLSWGYSFAFGWISFCVALLGGIVALADK